MFEIADHKVFMDIVHGYISVPRTFVKNIIDTELFQRLRNIDQTGMRILYPDAKHDRFAHSLGVYHLASKAVDALITNFSRTALYWNVRSDNTRDLFWAKNKVLFLLASLLHDIGHAPFSHSLENELLYNSGTLDTIVGLKNLISYREAIKDDIDVKTLGNCAAHELIGAIIIIKDYHDGIQKILNDLNAAQFPQTKEPFLFAEHFTPPPSIDSSNIGDDLCFIARMVLGLKYKRYEPEMQIRNCFIELLNGSNFDVDKLDYILRDTHMSGISNVGIDVERLLDAVNIVPLTEYRADEEKTRYFPEKTLISKISISGGYENSNKFVLKGMVKGKIFLETNSIVTIYENSIIESLSPSAETKDLPRINFLDTANFFNTSKIHVDAKRISTKSSRAQSSPITILFEDNPKPHSFSMDSAKIVDTPFEFKIISGAFELDLNNYCNVEINGRFSCDTLVLSGTTHDPACVTHTGIDISILGDKLTQSVPSQAEYNSFSIGFNKKAINVISNVLDARDYLYRWIYAHHKVVYYANFLIPSIASTLFSLKKRPSPFSKKFNIENLSSLDDAFLLSLMKYYSQIRRPVKCLIRELLSRNYKISLYKSLPEYDVFFDSFSVEERLQIFGFFKKNIDTDLPYAGNSGISAGFINKQILAEMLSGSRLQGKITEIVWIDASYKRKKNNPASTYIVFSKDNITTLSNVYLLDADSLNLKNSTSQYFYLYYTYSGSENNQKERITEELKEAVVSYLKQCRRAGTLSTV